MNNLIKNNYKKIIAGALAVAMVGGSAAVYTARSTSYADEDNGTQKEFEQAANNLINSANSSDDELSKEETTYAVLNADGSTKKVYVNEWLKNGTDDAVIDDYTTLKDFKNISGDEEYTTSGNSVTWHANGKDIKYQASYTGKLPVTVKVTYYLNGKKTDPDKMAGKSGDVEIHFSYDVNESRTVLSSGSSYNLKQPYAVVSGLMLDTNDFSDVSINSGKIVEQGNNDFVVGLAFPEMNENLDISKSSVDIPDEVVVRAQTSDFHIDGTYSVAMTGLFSDIDTSSADSVKAKMNELENGLDELSKASEKLVKGSDELADGAAKLAKGSKKLYAGTDEAFGQVDKINKEFQTLAPNLIKTAQGVDKLEKQLNDGLTQLNDGASQLSTGLKQLSANSKAINDGSDQIETAIFKSASDQLQKATGINNISLDRSNYKQVIEGIPSAAVKQAVETIRAQIKQAAPDSTESDQNLIMSMAYMMNPTSMKEITADIQKASKEAQEAAFVGNAAANAEYQKAAVAIIKAKGGTPDENTIIAYCTAMAVAGSTDSTVFGSDQVKAKVKELLNAAEDAKVAQQNTAANVQALGALAVQLKQLETGKTAEQTSAELQAVEKQLDSVVTYVNGVKTYTAGVDSAYKGSTQLLSGIQDATKKVDNGLGKFNTYYNKFKKYIPQIPGYANKFDKGMKQINDGAEQVSDGSAKLSKGADKLAEGMSKFDKDGIQKLVNSLDTKDLEKVSNRFRALADASKDPVFVGGKLSSMPGSSKIVFKTAEIK
ncbi:MAG: hypothetical protein PUB39_07445 [Eubacteriales bacterium]|nr:hypothetical protein [Eubacteriales bacterium]